MTFLGGQVWRFCNLTGAIILATILVIRLIKYRRHYNDTEKVYLRGSVLWCIALIVGAITNILRLAEFNYSFPFTSLAILYQLKGAVRKPSRLEEGEQRNNTNN
jgi:uncharacterized membrane protein